MARPVVQEVKEATEALNSLVRLIERRGPSLAWATPRNGAGSG